MRSAVGRVDGRGHDGQQTDAFCDAHGPCQKIRSTFKPVFRRFRLIDYAYKLLWVLDFEIWRFRVVVTTTDSTPTHARGVIHATRHDHAAA